MKSRHVFAIAAVFCLFLPALPGEAEIDRERMQRDLEIMEGILTSLHTQNTPGLASILREPQVRGIHFDNYGVIFLIEEERGPGEFRFEVDLKRILDEHAVEFKKLEEDDAQNDIAEQQKKRRAVLQDRLAEFLGTYADGIRQLDDKDKITVLVHHKPGPGVSYGAKRGIPGEVMYMRLVGNKQPYSELSEQVYLEVTTKKSDIVAYRREHINEAEFRKRVVSREHRPDASTTIKIGVMAAILDQTLKQNKHRFPHSNKTLGIYQEGLGALFFVKVQSTYKKQIAYTIVKEARLPFHRRRSGQAAKERNPSGNRLKDDLIEAVGDYGFSLRTLKPEEYIVVDARFPKGMRRKTSDPRGLVLKVKKQHVDAYTRKDLDLAAFREKVDIQEY